MQGGGRIQERWRIHSWDKGADGDEGSRGDEEFKARNLSPTSLLYHTLYLCVSLGHTLLLGRLCFVSCFVIPWDGCLGLCYGLTDTKAATARPWHLSVAYASIMSLCLGASTCCPTTLSCLDPQKVP